MEKQLRIAFHLSIANTSPFCSRAGPSQAQYFDEVVAYLCVSILLVVPLAIQWIPRAMTKTISRATISAGSLAVRTEISVDWGTRPRKRQSSKLESISAVVLESCQDDGKPIPGPLERFLDSIGRRLHQKERKHASENRPLNARLCWILAPAFRNILASKNSPSASPSLAQSG